MAATRRQRQQQETYGEGGDCCICLEEDVADVCLLPCRHFCCSDCLPRVASMQDLLSGNISQKKCPQCRSALSGFQKLSPADIRALKTAKASGSPSSQETVAVGIGSLSQEQTLATSTKPAPETKVLARTEVFCKFHPTCKSTIDVSSSAKNPNRRYHRCSTTEGRCAFIVWAGKSGSQNSITPHCFCDEACIIRVSHTEKNPDRAFWCCEGTQGKKCSVFAWAEPGKPGTQQIARQSPTSSTTTTRRSSSSSSRASTLATLQMARDISDLMMMRRAGLF